ncbi:MAG: Sip1-related alpha-galactosidase [Thermoproteus sp.]
MFAVVRAYFKDGVCIPSREGDGYNLCGRGDLRLLVDGDGSSGVVGVEANADAELADWPLDISVKADASAFVALTNAQIYDGPWQCNQAYVGKGNPEECAAFPSNYPKKPSAELDVAKWWIQPWATPYFGEDFPDLLPFTVALLASLKDGGYLALLAASSGDLSGYLWSGWTAKAYMGVESRRIGRSWILAYGLSGDPYEALRRAWRALAARANLRLRADKRRPEFLNYLGWCSWNAFLADVSGPGVVDVVRGLRERGVPVVWALIDDGWQRERKVEQPCCLNRVLISLRPDEGKFPGGFEKTVEGLRSLGVRWVGLWHTLNVHWGGFDESVERELGVAGIPYAAAKAPPPAFPEALLLYKRLYADLRGFDFVKVDNQCSARLIARYAREKVGRASASLQTALQLAADQSGLSVLNCMSMNPENYSNYFSSNVMRTSNDYLPYWREGARLHAISNAYGSLFFSEVVWPDFDMFSSYDPHAKLHLVLRVFSGGPVYITDRDPAKTNADLLKMAVLPNGEVVRVDFPAVPTRDVLFDNPYRGRRLLKLASTVRGKAAVAICNVSDRRAADFLSAGSLPFEYVPEVYYKVFSREGGRLQSGGVEVELEPLDCEVVILSRAGLIGLAEYILPPYPVVDGRPIAPGTPVEIR